MPGTSDLMSIVEKISSIGITPNQLINMFGAIATVNLANSEYGASQNTVLGAVFSGNLEEAMRILSKNARFYIQDPVARKQFLQLITSIGLAKVTVSLVQMFVRELK